MRVLALAALAAVSALPAQRTWIVDAAGGAGSHFRDLPTAVYSVTVVHGDRILVRPGTYTPAKIAKGVRIFGGPGVNLRQSSKLEISGIPAGRKLWLQGMTLTGDSSQVVITGNQGEVHIAGLQATDPGVFGPNHGIRIYASRAVSLYNCSVVGGRLSPLVRVPIRTPIAIDSSTVAMSSVVARALPADDGQQPTPSVPGVWVTGSDVTVQSCRLTGADTYSWGTTGPNQGWMPPTEAMRAANSKLRITGSRKRPTMFAPGASTYGGCALALSISGTQSAAVVDPDSARVNIFPIGAPAGTLVRQHVPSLLTLTTGPGGALIVGLDSVPLAPAYLFVASPRVPLPSPFGKVWLDPATIFLLASGGLNTNGQATVFVRIPAWPGLDGQLLALQAVVQNGGQLQMTPPAISTIH